MSAFAGLVDGDFEAYAPKKWRSNVYNRERLEVKQKLVALGRELAPHLAAADGSPLEVEPSVEHPALWNHKLVDAQHLFFSRNEGARKELDRIIERGQSLASRIDDPTPQRNHLFLALTIAHEQAEAALKLHPDARVDRQNLERKCEDHFEREKLAHLIARLPEGFRFGVGGTPLVEARTADEARVVEVLAAFQKPPPPAPAFLPPNAPPPVTPWFEVVCAFKRTDVVAAGPGFVEQARAALGALLPLYQFIAWSRDNDYVSMRDVLQKEKQAKRQRGLAKHDEVRVVRGMFTGKLGVVQEIDARGAIKLLVGNVAVKVDAEDVVKR